MRVGVLSDTHDRVPAIAEFVRRFQETGVSLVLHAGDYCAPFALDPFIVSALPVAGVFGRNDGDIEGLRAAAQAGVGIELFESPHSLRLGDHTVLLVHDLGDVQQRSVTAHEFVFHGMLHLQEMKTRGDTVLVNPGEACGWVHGAPTAAVVDLNSREVEFIKLDGPEWKF